MSDYETRRSLNDQSRNSADHHRDLWTVEQVEILQQFWDEAPLEQIALTVGHTVEACRQKFYMLRREESAPAVEAETKLQRVSKWTKGFTSLEEMGF